MLLNHRTVIRQMRIPTFLNATYSSDLKLNTFVSHALSQIEAHIEANKPVFFPEYTDHSVKHIELTLQTAIDLTAPAARGLLTTTDASALLVGVSLHDLGMYLTKEGFESLLAENSKWQGIDFFDPKSWRALWDDFYAEATRFDGRKLRQLFGDNYRPARPLPKGGAAWEDFDYLLVGEFLRRHHPRLAHEIALYGLPAKQGKAVEICFTSTEDQVFLADVSGLVARSHGIDLRTCMGYLQQKYKNRIDPRNSHPIYLSTLLRIADYFQIQASRAPSARTDVTSFQSSISQGEWTVHQSVKDINNTGGDPEAIVVIAEPKDVETFLKLKKWITGLQRELDQSWAILGEVYGLQVHTGLNFLGLKIRRVKSNIDDVAEFAKTVTYIPAQIAFEAANADLLKLLVGPLYGDKPGIGIRELFQNAIDAVREFNDTASHRSSLLSLDRYEQEADVTFRMTVDETGDPAEVIITDRGIGMTSEIVRDYFLRAGASFRQSDAWRREHEDKEGHSRVLRTGRFGVGALAAFLLGDEIVVTTRHAFTHQDEGLTFSARLDDSSISLIRVRAPVGTQIRIKIPKLKKTEIRKAISYPRNNEISYHSDIGHYFLKEPSLVRYRPDGTELTPTNWLPQPDDDFSEDWRWFAAPGFERIFWTYGHDYPNLACNGILIAPGSYRTLKTLWKFIAEPKMSVFDREGSLPVNLQRNGLQAEIPFRDELLASICDDLIAHAIVTAPARCNSDWFRGRYEGFSRYYEDWPAWLITRDGFVLNEGLLLSELNPSLLVVALGGKADLADWGEKIQEVLGAEDLFSAIKPNILDDTNPRIKGLFLESTNGGVSQPNWARVQKFATYVPQPLIEKVKRLRPGRAVSRALTRLDALPEKNGWKRLERFPFVPQALDETIISLSSDPQNPTIFCVLSIKVDKKGSCNPPLANRWMEVLRRPTIPLRMNLRRGLEAHAATHIKKLLDIRRSTSKKTKKIIKLDNADL
jgi:molecular chaperone HtpG